jgi:hypothetical protein
MSAFRQFKYTIHGLTARPTAALFSPAATLMTEVSAAKSGNAKFEFSLDEIFALKATLKNLLQEETR